MELFSGPGPSFGAPVQQRHAQIRPSAQSKAHLSALTQAAFIPQRAVQVWPSYSYKKKKKTAPKMEDVRACPDCHGLGDFQPISSASQRQP